MGALSIATLISLIIELPFSMVQGEHPTAIQNIIFLAADFLIALINVILSAGITAIHLNLARNKQISLGKLFYGFKNRPERFILASLLESLLLLHGAIPTLIGAAILVLKNPMAGLIFGILTIVSVILMTIIMLNIALTPYYVLEHPDMGISNCGKNSVHFMRGHKGKLLYIYLSFVGLQLLCILSFGIGSLWVAPYQNQTLANFYLDVTGQPLATDPNASETDTSMHFEQCI